jgi:uracil-DNA glycosylase
MAKRADTFPTAEAFMPERLSLPTLQDASKGCKGCDLYKVGTQTVFGEGEAHALVMFVGEQPGDQEDRAGKPFVGPSGQMLDAAMEKAGINRSQTYVTNAVKHFKWEPRGKRRLHVKPNAREITACKPWLKAEVDVIKPRIIVALGATAAQAMLGNDFKVTQRRGEAIRDTAWAPVVIATVHPSSLLRVPDEAARHAAIERFEEDLRAVKKAMDAEEKHESARPAQATRRAGDLFPGQDDDRDAKSSESSAPVKRRGAGAKRAR